jgi:uncharacterized protein
MTDTSVALASLRTNIDAFMDRVMEKHQDKMACAPGCASCCKVDLSVFPIEANQVKKALATLPAQTMAKIKERIAKEEFCPLLIDDHCAIYEERPIICRSQGIPLVLEEYQVDLCPEHIKKGLTLEDLGPDDLLNLERLNIMLVVLHRAHIKGTDELDDRVRLVSLVGA